MNYYTVNGFERVSKARARKLWGQGVTVYACPCKLRPGGPWYCEVILTKADRVCPTFDADVNAAAYCLTLCTETGRYLAFYVRQEATP